MMILNVRPILLFDKSFRITSLGLVVAVSVLSGCTWISGSITRIEFGSSTVSQTAPSAPTTFSVSTKVIPNRFLTTQIGPVANPTFVVSPVAVGNTVRVFSDSTCTTTVTTSAVATSTSVSVDIPTLTSYGLTTYYFQSINPQSGLNSTCSSSGLAYAYARYFLVNDLADTNRVDVTPGDGICLNASGFCSLMAAVGESAAWPAETYFFFDVATGTHPVSADLSILALNNKTIALYGVGTQPVFDGVTTTRLFASSNSAAVITSVLYNIRLTRFRSTVGSAAMFSFNTLYLNTVQIDANDSNGANHILGGSGVMPMSDIYAESTTITGNTGAGALLIKTGGIKFYDVTVSSNTGFIDIRGASGSQKSISNSLFTGNTSASGTIRFGTPSGGTLDVTNSTFTGNSRDAIGTVSLMADLTINISNSTFFQNATAAGREFRLESGATLIFNISNSIVAVNNGARVNCLFAGGGGTETVNLSYTLVDDLTCGAGGTGNVFSVSPNLAALALNGGTTQNLMPNGGSPVINAGDNLTCQTTDQRSVARPIGGTCDMGAVESP